MSIPHYLADELPERGKPRPPVQWIDGHSLVLRALYWHHRNGALATDQSIYDVIVRFKGKVIAVSGARTRRAELVNDFGLCVKGSATGLTESGRSCATWRLTEAGIARARADFEASRQMTLDTERTAA